MRAADQIDSTVPTYCGCATMLKGKPLTLCAERGGEGGHKAEGGVVSSGAGWGEEGGGRGEQEREREGRAGVAHVPRDLQPQAHAIVHAVDADRLVDCRIEDLADGADGEAHEHLGEGDVAQGGNPELHIVPDDSGKLHDLLRGGGSCGAKAGER